jgi:group I intron endonuclease
MSIGIYKITNPTNKIYIGQSINIPNRWKQYKTLDKSCIGIKLINSLKKYGPENHKFEIIEECSIEQLNDREVYWKQYCLKQVNENWSQVLFCELYDVGGGPRSEEVKKKISNSSIGKNNKKILQYCLKGNFIKEWHSIREAEDFYKTGIKDALKQKTNQSSGFIWRYKENPLNDDFIFNKHKNNKIVNQYNLDGDFIKEWNSTIEIERTLGFKNSNISNCCNNKRQKTAYGFKWKYKKENSI